MRCSSCGSKNSKRAKFCIECGVRFGSRCPRCGTDNSPRAKFCAECGASMPAAPTGGEPAKALAINAPAGDVESSMSPRHVSVLLCDLVDSAGLAGLNREERREIVADYHRAATEAIERYGGHVTNNVGDSIMAYFGWPEALHDHAQRAGDAGLAILDAVETLNQNPARSKLSARIGILSGTTVTGGG